MKALILAGGKGTRLRPLTVYQPKPIVPFVNRPFLIYQIEILRRAGIEDITLSLNYQPDKIRHLLGEGSEFGVNLTYVTEPSPMGTAGAYRYALGDSAETTVVLNGDILTDLIVKNLLNSHIESKSAATICLYGVSDPSAYGVVETDENGSVIAFREKPKLEELDRKAPNLINAGIYVLEPEILNLVPKNKNCSFEYEVFPSILEKRLKFDSYVFKDEFWCDIGTTDKYLDANLDFIAGKVRHFEAGGRAESADIATAASIDDLSVIGENCVIKPNARIVNSIIGDGVHIQEKAIVKNSVIWPHTRISDSAQILNAVVAKSCYIGKNATVGKGSVLGDKTSLTDYTKV